MLRAYASRIGDIRMATRADREELARVEENAAQVSRDLGRRETDQAKLERRLIMIGLPVIGIALIVMLLTPLLYRTEDLRRSILTSGMLVELMTIFLLTTSVIILGVDGRIQAEVIGTLLGGLSGYVLGRSVNPPTRQGREVQDLS